MKRKRKRQQKKTKKKTSWSAMDEVRHPTPPTGAPFKDRKRDLQDKQDLQDMKDYL